MNDRTGSAADLGFRLSPIDELVKQFGKELSPIAAVLAAVIFGQCDWKTGEVGNKLSEGFLAKRIGVQRETVHRGLLDLARLGIIELDIAQGRAPRIRFVMDWRARAGTLVGQQEASIEPAPPPTVRPRPNDQSRPGPAARPAPDRRGEAQPEEGVVQLARAKDLLRSLDRSRRDELRSAAIRRRPVSRALWSAAKLDPDGIPLDAAWTMTLEMAEIERETRAAAAVREPVSVRSIDRAKGLQAAGVAA